MPSSSSSRDHHRCGLACFSLLYTVKLVPNVSQRVKEGEHIVVLYGVANIPHTHYMMGETDLAELGVEPAN